MANKNCFLVYLCESKKKHHIELTANDFIFSCKAGNSGIAGVLDYLDVLLFICDNIILSYYSIIL